MVQPANGRAHAAGKPAEPFAQISDLVRTAARFGGVQGALQAVPFIFPSEAAAEAFRSAVEESHPAMQADAVRVEVEGQRYAVDVRSA